MDDPAQLTPFINALARISDAEMKCERHLLEMQERNANLHQADPTHKAPGLRPETRQQLEKELNIM